MKTNFSRIFFYLWPVIKKYKFSFVMSFVGYGIGVFFDHLFRPTLYKKIIDTITAGGVREEILADIYSIAIILCVVILIHVIFYRVGDFAVVRFQSRAMKDLYDIAFNRLLKHSYNFFSNNFSGSIVAKSKRLVKSFETFGDVVFFQIWFSFLMIVGVSIILLFNAPIIAAMFFVWSLIYIFVTFLFIRKKIPYDILEAEADSKVTGSLADAILNILNVKVFSADTREEENFQSVTTEELKRRRKSWDFANIQNVVQGFMMAVLHISVLFTSIHLWYTGVISIGTIVLIQVYIINLFEILWNLGRSLTRAIKALTDMKEVVDIFDLPIDILDPEAPEELRVKNGNIKFDNVSFSYKGGIKVFENFNLEIKPGERVGFVGHSGAGKSTITKLLLRFADVDGGSITIDGQEIKNITQNDLRSVISYVPQESILFHRTITENIGYGKPGATQEEILEVSKKAHAHEFVSKLTKNYDTLVGERGIKLSGGERQRIAIARAMLKNSPILVLDEATSSLDSVSEHYIQEAFIELMKDKTTLVIAHRLSTIQKMDRIVVLEEGEIVEMGTHKELLKQDGVYANLWNHQTGGFIE